MASSGDAATQHAECCICFDDLCSEPIAVLLTKSKKRACCHYFHYDCIKDLCPFVTRGYGMEMEVEESSDAAMKCPMCRAACQRVVKMPDPAKDPRSWFALADHDHTGHLSKENIRDVIKATCDVSEGHLTQIINRNWHTWDSDGSGGVSERELPNLLHFVKKNVPRKTRRGEPPHIATDKQGWFDFWDEDGSGELEKGEVGRALIKTFERGHQHGSKVKEIQSALENAWPLFDRNGSSSISKREFLCKDGLADTVIAFLQADSSFSAEAAREAQLASPPAVPATPPQRSGYRGSGNGSPRHHRQRAASSPSAVGSGLFPSSPPSPGGQQTWKCPRCTYAHPAVPPHCAMCHSPNASFRQHAAQQRVHRNSFNGSPVSSPGGSPGGANGGAGRPRGQSSSGPFLCVVCGAMGRNGEQRRSGWKCTECVGKPHRLQVRYVVG